MSAFKISNKKSNKNTYNFPMIMDNDEEDNKNPPLAIEYQPEGI